ncbi:MAG: hypothetical protein K2X36_07375 [Microbacteriaceae bacterium]|nr:hypothetical protein [Microbacteriaceae bacterium]
MCAAPLREAARFCTRCGAPVHAVPTAAPVPAVVPNPAPVAELPLVHQIEPRPRPEPPPEPIPARIPTRGRVTPPPARSTAATWALVTGIAPLIVSIIGNLVAAQLGVAALERVEAGDPQGAWAPVLVTLALVFVANAALLTVCTIAGGRGLRETANGFTRGRGLAVAGLATGGVNLVLWVAGLIVSISGLTPVLG